jgi:hypothetical protein
MADGEEVDIDRFQRTANSLRRLCESVGLTRRAKVIDGLEVVRKVRQSMSEAAAKARATATDAETDGGDDG